jgi:diacylglycerol diphosphate phosphatase / phosphatidate phosphatase
VPAYHRPVPHQTTADGQALIDLTFANEYHPNETIPGSLLNILCVWIPIGLFALMGVFLGPRRDFHAALCSYLLTMGMKIFAVACIKRYSGYLRPSFYNMCQFNPDTQLCDDESTSARESFPSGHAATALSSMTLLTLFLLGKVRGGSLQRGVKLVTDDPMWDAVVWTPSSLSKLLAVMSLWPIGLGMFIATSRVRDNWHHPADVVCGSIVGASCALFAHSLWYVHCVARSSK